MSCIRRALPAAAFALLLLALASKPLVHLLTEAWWFEAVGFAQVFWTRLGWRLLLFTLTFLAYGAFLWGNHRWALSRTRAAGWLVHSGPPARPELDPAGPMGRRVARAVIVLVALGAAASTQSGWLTVLKALKGTPFAARDPIFARDIGFHLFRLPFYEGLHRWLLGLVLTATLLAGGVYLLQSGIRAGRRLQLQLNRAAAMHLSVLLGSAFLLVAWGFWLGRFGLLTRVGKVVFGAGYTDIHARLPAYGVMVGLSLAMAILLLYTLRGSRQGLLLRGLALFLLSSVVFQGLWPWLMQQLIVSPNELDRERPYLEHNIAFTQAAYRLQAIEKERYSPTGKLGPGALEDNRPTIANIRLWDYRPILSTYRQLQEIRLYYQFRDVDIDRYTLSGLYQQVILSARELAFERLPRKAQTWVNRHLIYTHGYGLAMSPVNRVTADGLPELVVKDIPPVSSVDLPVKQPAIYYGEGTGHYVITGSRTDEFDYPAGDRNVYSRYGGKGGVPVGSIGRRLAYAWDLGSLEVLISDYLSDQSRLHYHRTVRERARQVAPFLRFDKDPYLVVIDGRLQWLLDAYTVSDRYPYAQPIDQLRERSSEANAAGSSATIPAGTNYIRNAVKVLVDAYDGSLKFYVVDASDPVLNTYRRIFPQLFEPAGSTPGAVKAHFRYPEDLFRIQTSVYQTYHMDAPEAFYNREDLWSLPRQTYEGDEGEMEPYYVIMRLPGEERLGFILIQPFTPANKDNMTAWMAARSNGDQYGELLLYQFPKKMLVYGPRQIEARIDQDPTISQQFTLWSQAGSKVIRGNLLVIPIEQSLLYVEPVYLRAERGELPELKRVIVVNDQKVVMEPTLEQAVAKVFGDSPETRPGSAAAAGETGGPRAAAGSSALPGSALDTFRRSQEALRQGNWADYGRLQQELEGILRRMAK
jgi:uncharacterized membrane protein (UPF0182 family)